jgi:tetrahydromethanopterin S-methyltransferase subunit E
MSYQPVTWADRPVATTFLVTLGVFWLVPVLLFVGFALCIVITLAVSALLIATGIIGSACKFAPSLFHDVSNLILNASLGKGFVLATVLLVESFFAVLCTIVLLSVFFSLRYLKTVRDLGLREGTKVTYMLACVCYMCCSYIPWRLLQSFMQYVREKTVGKPFTGSVTVTKPEKPDGEVEFEPSVEPEDTGLAAADGLEGSHDKLE